MKNTIKIELTEFGGIQVLSIPLKLYKDSYNTTAIECLVPKRNTEKSLLKMYASGRDSLGYRVWTSQTYNLVYEKDIQQNQKSFELYKARLPQEFCKNTGHIELTLAYYALTEEDTVEQLLTSGTVNLYIDGIGNNSAGVAISPYDSTAAKVNKLTQNIAEIQDWTANDIPISKAERLIYDNVQEMLNGLNANKVDKVQVEKGKLLLSNGIGGIQASDVGIQEYEDQKGYIDRLHTEQEQRMDNMQAEIAENSKERHNHINKQLLDSYTVPNSEILESVDKMHEHTNKEILDGITEAFTTALKGNVEDSITNVELDSNTGIFTFTKNNGEQITVDTLLEKILVNFWYDSEKQALIFEAEDESLQEIEIGALLSPYQGSDGREITVTVDRDNIIGASIKAGAVTEQKLAPNILEGIQTQFAAIQAELEAIKADREQIIKDSWLYHHPVGSAILTYSTKLSPNDKEFDPNDKGGVWELEKAGFALWTTEGADAVGTRNADGTIAAGLPNIKGNGLRLSDAVGRESFGGGAFIVNGVGVVKSNWGDNMEFHDIDITFDANAGSQIKDIYRDNCNTVQPPAVKIKLWRRKA